MGPDHLHHLDFEDCRFYLVQEPDAPSPETLAFSVFPGSSHSWQMWEVGNLPEKSLQYGWMLPEWVPSHQRPQMTACDNVTDCITPQECGFFSSGSSRVCASWGLPKPLE